MAIGYCCLAVSGAGAATNVALTEVPDYDWWRGCFGTGCGNLMGYWDRHGFPDFYTGPTAGGVAPLDSSGPNEGIRSMWASKAGFDGRPLNQPGHEDDYWIVYESTAPDPYVTAGRAEHPPDCIGDFIGLNQNRWSNMNGECDGNIDGFSFVYWDTSGNKRINFVPGPEAGLPPRDIQSGMKAWTEYRGGAGEVFTQLTDFNSLVPSGRGFTFEDLRAEIDGGYPVLLFLQHFDSTSRMLDSMSQANPYIHGMLAYGYYISESGVNFVRYKTSWGSSGNNTLSQWSSDNWQAELPVRGVIGYHPLPQIKSVTRSDSNLTLSWHGPSSILTNLIDHTSVTQHWYVVEMAGIANPKEFVPISSPTASHQFTVTNCCNEPAFFRVKLVKP